MLTLPTDAKRWGVCGAIMLCAHFVPAAAYMHWSASAPALPSAPPAPIMLDLAPIPSSPAAPASEAEPGPEQIEQIPEPEAEPEPEPEPEPPPEKPPEVALPEPKPEPKPKPKPPQETPPQEQPPAEKTTAPPAAEATPELADSGAPPGVQSAVQADALLSYQQRLLAHLERHKRYPYASQRQRQEGVAYLQFRMNRQGDVISFELQQSSGHAALDREVLAMIKRATPLPSIPDALDKTELKLVVPVEFFIRRR